MSEYELPSLKPYLRPMAVPSLFPWTGYVFQRDSITSMIAASSKERYNFIYKQCRSPVDEWDDNSDALMDAMDSQSSELHVLENKVLALESRIKELEDELQS